MPATDRERAFDRFWRAPDAGNDGSGLDATVRLAPAANGQRQAQRRPAHSPGARPPQRQSSLPADPTHQVKTAEGSGSPSRIR